MKNPVAKLAAMIFGIIAAVALYLYITGCYWQPKSLLLVLAVMVAAFSCGLYLSESFR